MFETKAETKNEKVRQIIQTLDSLNDVMSNSEGEIFSYCTMKNTTLLEFLCDVAAPNGIRFHKASKLP